METKEKDLNCPFKFASFLAPNPAKGRLINPNVPDLVTAQINVPCDHEMCMAWNPDKKGCNFVLAAKLKV